MHTVVTTTTLQHFNIESLHSICYVASWIVSACYNLGDIQVLANLPHDSLHKLWSVIRAQFIRHSTREDDALHDRLAHAVHLPIGKKFQHGLTREQIHHDQNTKISPLCTPQKSIPYLCRGRSNSFCEAGLKSRFSFFLRLLALMHLAQVVQTASMMKSIPGQ